MNEQDKLQSAVNTVLNKVKEGKTKKEIIEDEAINSSLDKFKAYIISSDYKRVLYNNYDTWKYRIHNLNYRKVKYKGVEYDGDDYYDRGELMCKLLEDKIITRDYNKNGYRIRDITTLIELYHTFKLVNERNTDLNERAIILNLKKISVLQSVE